ncbi:MAG: AI-2E family transporter [Acidimicrobiales bacterium]
MLRVWELAITKTGGYISSRMILAASGPATFHWVVFRTLGLPSPIALGLWVGISQFIPAIGTYLAGILPVLVAVGIEPAKALWVIGVIVVYQQIENYVLQPRITAQTLICTPRHRHCGRDRRRGSPVPCCRCRSLPRSRRSPPPTSSGTSWSRTDR